MGKLRGPRGSRGRPGRPRGQVGLPEDPIGSTGRFDGSSDDFRHIFLYT